MLRQMQDLGIISESFQILLGFAILQFADLSLCESKPPPKELLI
jgi:hypothetical protein